METWRLLEVEFEDPLLNLSVEEAISLSVGNRDCPPTIRLWRNPKSIVIGRFQKPELEVDLNECKAREVPIVKRMTGGGAVFHDLGNLNSTIVLPKANRLIENENKSSYEILGSLIIEGLNRLGISASRSVNNIFVGGKKVSGMAAARKNNVVFQHGTLLVDSNLQCMEDLLEFKEFIDSKSKFVRSNPAEVINIKSISSELTLSDVIVALENSVEDVFDVSIFEGSLSDLEKEKTKEIFSNKKNSEEYY